jgi:hypothetical protein
MDEPLDEQALRRRKMAAKRRARILARSSDRLNLIASGDSVKRKDAQKLEEAEEAHKRAHRLREEKRKQEEERAIEQQLLKTLTSSELRLGDRNDRDEPVATIDDSAPGQPRAQVVRPRASLAMIVNDHFDSILFVFAVLFACAGFDPLIGAIVVLLSAFVCRWRRCERERDVQTLSVDQQQQKQQTPAMMQSLIGGVTKAMRIVKLIYESSVQLAIYLVTLSALGEFKALLF